MLKLWRAWAKDTGSVATNHRLFGSFRKGKKRGTTNFSCFTLKIKKKYFTKCCLYQRISTFALPKNWIGVKSFCKNIDK
jgi:hypothetical protein